MDNPDWKNKGLDCLMNNEKLKMKSVRRNMDNPD